MKPFSRILVVYGVVIALVALLPGCSTTQTPEPRIVTQEVVVPGPPAPCVPANVSTDTQVYPDTDAALLAAPDAAARYLLMASGRLLRIARLGEIEPVIHACPKKTAQ